MPVIGGVPGVRPAGAYSAATVYIANDVVIHNGSSYVATAGGSGVAPPDPSRWQLLASGGSRWFTGTGAPVEATLTAAGARAGDLYLDTASGTVYELS